MTTIHNHSPPVCPPAVVDPVADAAFRAQAAAMGYDHDDRWVGGYVAVEWEGGRHLIGAYADNIEGAALLELGCNDGASAIVAAVLGARVTGVDIDAETVALARLNAARHGVADRIDLRHLPDTRRLPFAEGCFDLVLCISVLEYVLPDQLPAVLGEIETNLHVTELEPSPTSPLEHDHAEQEADD